MTLFLRKTFVWWRTDDEGMIANVGDGECVAKDVTEIEGVGEE